MIEARESDERRAVRHGGCACRSIAFSLTAAPGAVHWCHCGICRRATGAAAAVLVWVPRTAVLWTGAPAMYRTSSVARRGFCGRCGSPLFLQYDRSDEVALMVGAFDEPATLRPGHHYGAESMLPWNDHPDGLARRATDLADPMLAGLCEADRGRVD
jgi:hypothetical protein